MLIQKLAYPAPVKGEQKGPVRGAFYGADVVRRLTRLWVIFDGLCGQRLAPNLNVAELRREIDELKDRLSRMVESKPGSDGDQITGSRAARPFRV